jgi:hypothetical protein
MEISYGTSVIRHHRICTTIANALRNRGLAEYEELHCNFDAGSNRRVDIIVFDKEPGAVS